MLGKVWHCLNTAIFQCYSSIEGFDWGVSVFAKKFIRFGKKVSRGFIEMPVKG